MMELVKIDNFIKKKKNRGHEIQVSKISENVRNKYNFNVNEKSINMIIYRV